MSSDPSARRRLREQLIAARMAMDEKHRAEASAAIGLTLRTRFPPARFEVVGGYWPIRGEFDCLDHLKAALSAGRAAALPAVVAPRAPLEFRPWRPDAPMATGPSKIPQPACGPATQPDLVLVPLVGFDAFGRRLGYGGGYYDRTLAAWAAAAPVTVGLGFELGRLESFEPAPHDRPMDFVITEAGLFEGINGRGSFV
jgi:5-formyltetrahydrofolate cyclo-ligase